MNMKNRIVGPYVMKQIMYRNDAIALDDEIGRERIEQILMSRKEYRQCLEINFPDLYEQLKELQFLYIKRD